MTFSEKFKRCKPVHTNFKALQITDEIIPLLTNNICVFPATEKARLKLGVTADCKTCKWFNEIMFKLHRCPYLQFEAEFKIPINEHKSQTYRLCGLSWGDWIVIADYDYLEVYPDDAFKKYFKLCEDKK